MEVVSKEINKVRVRQGGRRKIEWTGKVLVVVVFGVPGDTTREFESKCNDTRL